MYKTGTKGLFTLNRKTLISNFIAFSTWRSKFPQDALSVMANSTTSCGGGLHHHSSTSPSSALVIKKTIDKRCKTEIINFMRQGLEMLLTDESHHFFSVPTSSLHRLLVVLLLMKKNHSTSKNITENTTNLYSQVIHCVVKGMAKIALRKQPFSSSNNNSLSSIERIANTALTRLGHRLPFSSQAGQGGCWLLPTHGRILTGWEDYLLLEEQRLRTDDIVRTMTDYHHTPNFIGFQIQQDYYRESDFDRWFRSNPFNHGWFNPTIMHIWMVEDIQRLNQMMQEAKDNFILKPAHVESTIKNYIYPQLQQFESIWLDRDIVVFDAFMKVKLSMVSTYSCCVDSL